MADSPQKGKVETSDLYDDVILKYHERCDAGEVVNVKEFIEAHPQFRRELQKFFETVSVVEHMAGPMAARETGVYENTIITDNSKEGSIAGSTVRTLAASAPGPTSDSDDENSFQQFGRYRILKELGWGAMGAVYLAHDQQLDREVALKIPQLGTDISVGMLERFYREARAAAALRHPGICPVFDVGQIDGQHYITMAYIPGRSLRDFTKSSKRQEGKQVARVIRKIALAMADAHEHTVIHRDLKPANVMIDKRNEPVVMDFGLARRSVAGEERLTHTGTIVGTPAYMSPEQVDGDNDNVGPAADIYSLGVIFYELLTGQLPFQGNLMSIVKQIATKDPRPPRERFADIDIRLQSLCLKMLAKQPNDRPVSMAQVAKELSDWLQGRQAPTDESGALETSRVSDRDRKQGMNAHVADPTSIPEQQQTESAPQQFLPVANYSYSTSKKSSRPGGQMAGRPKNRRLLIAGGLVGAVILLAGLIFYVRLGKYDVQIKLDHPGMSLKVDGQIVIIDGSDHPIRLSAGPHELNVEMEGLTTQTCEFTVKKDGKNAVYVAIVDGKLAVTPGNQPSLKSAMTQVERTNAGDSLPADGDPQTPSAPDFALQFTLEDGPLQQIEIPIASLDPNLPWTLEGDIQPADITSHNHGLIAIFGEDTWQLRLKHWSLELVEQSGPVQQDRNENIIVTTSMASWRGKCVHVAAVYDGKQAWMFIDGKLISRASPQFLPKRNLGILILGARFNGRMDEWRVSKVARYEKDFTPPKRYESDPDTIALYHFDEGSGDLLRDSSGNDHTGTIQGAKWVTSDKESIGPASNAPASGVVYLDDLPETVWRGYNELGKHGNYLGVNPVKQNGSLVAHSLFTAPSPQDFSAAIEYDLAGQYAMFDATICLLCEPKDPQKFRVLIDDKLLWESIRQSTPNVETAVSVDVRNAQRLRLEVKGLPSYSWPVWLYPRLTPAATSKLDATTPGPPTAKAPFDAQQAHMHQEEYSFGDHSSDLDQHGWHLDNAGFMCHPVAEKKPNSFGLFDIHGNLEEWCGTEFDEVGDAKKTPNVPPKAEHKTFYAVRGGHWYFSTALCRSAFRGDSPPTQRYNTLGFRIAQEIKAVP